MNFFGALKKIISRKKTKGYYEASQILTVEEKQSLVIASAILIVPFMLSLILMLSN